jgi:hypothetical protein
MAHTECDYCPAGFHENSGEKAFEDWEKHMKGWHPNEWRAMTPRQIAAMEWKMKMMLRNQTPQIL